MTERLEGNGGQRLLQLFKRDNPQQVTQVRRGTVVNPPPNISIMLEGYSEPVSSAGIVVAEHLTDHIREWRLVGSGAYQQYEIKSNLKAGDTVICADDGQTLYIIDKEAI